MKEITRVFIISLDGATFDVLRPLVEQGYMPNLGNMMEQGLIAPLESVIPPVTAPAWTSFMTGKQPSKHGIFDFSRYDRTSSAWQINNSRNILSKTLWQILSEHGKRVVVLNLPYTYPAYPVNGVMVSGWDAPTTRAFTYPAAVQERLFDIVPDYGADLDLTFWNYLPADSDGEFSGFIDKLVRSSEQSAKVASHFLASEEWDMFMVHFQQTDWIQHKLWSYIERACADANDKDNRVEAVRKCYQKFDEVVGRLLAGVRAANPVRIVLSDHGFGPCRGMICPNYFLNQWGYFNLKQNGAFRRAVKNSALKPVRQLYRFLARSYQAMQQRLAARKYKSWADMVEESGPEDKFPVDWTSTRVAALAGSEVGLLYVNLRGNHEQGLVQSGAEYEGLLADLISRFGALSDPVTGQKVLRRVIRGREMYPAVSMGVAVPDLVLIPTDGYVFSTSVNHGVTQDNSGGGNHRHNGVLFVQGEGIRYQLHDFRPCLLDMAPTLLHMLGHEVPEDMDGRVLQEMFVNPRPVVRGQASGLALHDGMGYAENEARLIQQRLKGLGYLD